MKKPLQSAMAVAVVMSLLSITTNASDPIRVVGSSTVYPFATVVAERFGRSSGFKTPIIEATGSGGGLKLFCAGISDEKNDHPDITNASRRIKSTELSMCIKNGVTDVVEVQVGFDGIVIANSIESTPYSLTRKDIFLALAKEVPNPNKEDCGTDGNPQSPKTCLIANPYKTWNEVNSTLPNKKIEVLGPPPTSGTRDAFAELALEGGCKAFGWIKKMKKVSKSKYKAVCHTIREDGHYIESGENDNLIVNKLRANPAALGVFGFSFLEQNMDSVQGAKIEGKSPAFESIADKSYPISRPLYFYVKKAHIGMTPGLEAYLKEFTSEKAWGDDGYLADKGMIPLDKKLRTQYAKAAAELITLTMEDLQQ